MSTIVMSACWPLKMPSTVKAVLISLADNANDHGVCWPSIETISRRTCMHRATVIRAITALEKLGYLVADRSNGRHTNYTITPNLGLFDNQSHKATGRRKQQVAYGNRSQPATNQSHRATAPVAESDTNRKEPSRTVTKSESRARANEFEAKAAREQNGTDPMADRGDQGAEEHGDGVPTPSGVVCCEMAQLGYRVNPSNPNLLRLLDAGVPPDEVTDCAREFQGKNKSLAFICATVAGRRRDAATAGAVPAKSRSKLRVLYESARSGNNDSESAAVPVSDAEKPEPPRIAKRTSAASDATRIAAMQKCDEILSRKGVTNAARHASSTM